MERVARARLALAVRAVIAVRLDLLARAARLAGAARRGRVRGRGRARVADRARLALLRAHVLLISLHIDSCVPRKLWVSSHIVEV